jgi:hypothetical protein
MSERDPVALATTTMATQQRPAPNGYSTWNDYWTRVHNQPWRTQSEIDEARWAYLDERRRKITPDIAQGRYPFKGITLTRADVEWLLATHDSGGVRGPVDWDDSTQHRRTGLDLRGADLRDVDLNRMPLARVRAGLGGGDSWAHAEDPQREMAAAQIQGTILTGAHLEGAELSRAHL